MDPASLVAAHAAHLQARTRLRRRPATLRGYTIYIGRYLEFLEWSGEPLVLESLNSRLVGDFQDWLRANSTGGTRDGAAAEKMAVRLLKCFSRWLWRRGFYSTDPLARVEEPRLAKLHREPFSESQVRHLVEAARLGPAPELERALLLLGLDTGARIGELCGLEIDDVDYQRGSLVFRRTKNGRSRRVYFGVADALGGGPCLIALRAWLRARTAADGVEALFTTADGQPLTTARARRIYAALGKSAAVPDCLPHRGRHTHASELLAEMPGAELQLRHRLGHLSPDVLADYITIPERSARQVASIASLSAKWNL